MKTAFFSYLKIAAILSCSLPIFANAASKILEHRQPEYPASFEDQLIYHRAFEVVIWAVPMVNTLHLREELQKHGVKNGTLAYLGSPPSSKTELPTYNNTTPYVFGSVSLSDGPMVIEIPPVSDKAKYFGTVFNIWDSAIEDFGPAGIDKGKGGRFVVTPPNWKGIIPKGYQKLKSTSFDIHFLLRSVPAKDGEQGWDDAVKYSKNLKLYPLADAASPKANEWFDVTKIDGYFHGVPHFDISTFKLINTYVQEEFVQEYDKPMHGMLGFLGIEKGKPFNPDKKIEKILDQAARDAETYMRSKLQNGDPFTDYWPDKNWGIMRLSPEVMSSLATWNFDDRLDYHARAIDYYYLGVGIPKRFAGNKGAAFYLFATVDDRGEVLDNRKTYRLHVPAGVPASDFWSLILYSTRTRSFTDSSKFGLSSKDNLQKNTDGSVDLYIGPKPPDGKKVNWLETKAGDGLILCFRIYGPTKPIRDNTWKLSNLEMIE